jgi:O-methyltransferase
VIGPTDMRTRVTFFKNMRLKRRIANWFIRDCGVSKLHKGRLQKLIRSICDEIDLQHLRDSHPCESFVTREDMFRYLHESRLDGDAIDYLEFGVYRGESINCWVKLNKNANSRFFGFDSFEGLPEDWRGGQQKGHFNVGGEIPRIDDRRVQFVRGWFGSTVPEFARCFAPRNRMVIHLDADLYSSTMLALMQLGPFMAKGTLLMFDEFYDREHEFRALMDWQRVYKREFRIVAEVDNFSKVCAELE